MKLNMALLIAKDCGLETVGEAILNIDMHSMNIFNYGEIGKELKELYEDFNKSGLKNESLVNDCLNYFILYTTAKDDGGPVYIWCIGGGHMTQSNLYDATKFTTRALAEKRLEVVKGINGFKDRVFDIIEVDRRIYGLEPRHVINYEPGFISEDELRPYNFTDHELKIIREMYFKYPKGFFKNPRCALY